MKSFATLMTAVFAAAALSGCFGGSADSFDYEPGEFKETGKTVELRMWVEDVVKKPIYPGLDVNMWAFCAEPVDPDDQYSADAIEYWDEGKKCSVPGPTLRVNQGDRIIVRFENDHFHSHTIHWHGQHIETESDGVPGVTQDSVVQGAAFTYDFIARRAGTLWYHCHVDVQFHVMMGLIGMIIVEPQDKTYEPKDIDKEFIMVLSEARREHVEYIPPLPGETVDPHAQHKHGQVCGASGVQGCKNPAVSIDSDIFMLNGESFPNTLDDPKSHLFLEPGERVRVRILNAGHSTETWHWHGHDVLVTHKDGNPLPPDSRYWAETLAIGAAERYDVVLEGHTDEKLQGNWVQHTHVEDHATNSHQAPGGMLTMISYGEPTGDPAGYAPFNAELPGGTGFVRPRVVPEDQHIEFGQLFTAAPNIEAEIATIPLEDLCLVDKVHLGFHLYGDTLKVTTSEITVTVQAPNGQKQEFLLGGQGGAVAGGWNPPRANLTVGEYKVTATGNASDVSLHASGALDYFQTEDLAKDAGRPC